jgi:hypothetical protein
MAQYIAIRWVHHCSKRNEARHAQSFLLFWQASMHCAKTHFLHFTVVDSFMAFFPLCTGRRCNPACGVPAVHKLSMPAAQVVLMDCPYFYGVNRRFGAKEPKRPPSVALTHSFAV